MSQEPESLSATLRQYSISRLQLSHRLRGLNVVILNHTGRLAPKETSLLKFIRQIRKYPQFGHASNSTVSASFDFGAESVTNRSSSPTGTKSFQLSPGDLQDVQ